MRKKQIGFEIKSLADCPRYAAICAHWAYGEWFAARDIPFDVNLLAYEKRARGEGLPTTFVAISDTLPVGMATLKQTELWKLPNVAPWLSALYVLPAYRKQGVGARLINAVKANAARWGFDSLHLFLGQSEATLAEYYENLGWQFFCDAEDNDGFTTKVYKILLEKSC